MKNKIYLLLLTIIATIGSALGQTVTVDGVIYQKNGVTANINGKVDADIIAQGGVVTIQKEVFFAGDLEPTPVTGSRLGVFRNMTVVTEVRILANFTSMEAYLFYGCLNLEKIIIEEGAGGVIGQHAFNFCPNLTTVVLPEGVTKLLYQSFGSTSSAIAETLSIPSTVELIEQAAFGGNMIKAFDVDNDNEHYKTIDGVIFSKDGKTLVAYPAGRESSSYTIPSGVETIGDGAFQFSTLLSEVIIPEGVTNIAPAAFHSVRLTAIELPKSLISLGDQAFRLSALTEITIPENVTNIGNGAFSNSANLKEVVFEGESDLESIGNNAFQNTDLESIAIPGGVERIGDGAFKGNENLSEIIFGGDTPPVIGDGAFEGISEGVVIAVPEGSEDDYAVIADELSILPEDILTKVDVVISLNLGDGVILLDGSTSLTTFPHIVTDREYVILPADREKHEVVGVSINSTFEEVTRSSDGEFRVKFTSDLCSVEVTVAAKKIVTFIDGGNTADVQYVKNGERAVAPSIPSNAGYTFNGWITGSALWNFATAVTADLTLTSSWTATPTNTVTINSLAGVSVSRSGGTVETGSTFSFSVTADGTVTAYSNNSLLTPVSDNFYSFVVSSDVVITFSLTAGSGTTTPGEGDNNGGSGSTEEDSKVVVDGSDPVIPGDFPSGGEIILTPPLVEPGTTPSVTINGEEVIGTWEEDENGNPIYVIPFDGLDDGEHVLVVDGEEFEFTVKDGEGEGDNNGGNGSDDDGKVVIDGSDPVIPGDFPSGGEIILTPPLVEPGTTPSVTINGEEVIGTWEEDENGNPIYVIPFDGLEDGEHVLVVNDSEFEFTTSKNVGATSNDVLSSSAKVTASYGAITIDTPKTATVYVVSLSGSVVYNAKVTGTVTVNVPAGIYVVAVDGTTTKVVIR